MKRLLYYWLLMVCIVTFVCVACYGTAQQLNRQSANDPQVQIAEDTAAALESGKYPATLVADKVDISKSLAPFIMIFDENENVLASSAVLNGAAPSPPHGLLDNVPEGGYSWVTWQTSQGYRFATVTVRYGGTTPGYVLVARSLRETEARIDRIGNLIVMGWIVGVVGFLVLLVVLPSILVSRKKIKKEEKQKELSEISEIQD